MKKTFALLVLVSVIAATAFAQKQARTDADWTAMVEAERAFAAASKEKGMREAFLAYLAEGSILFRPTPVDGRKVWLDRKDASGILTWQPSLAEVSRSGDFGYTTGPWEFRQKSLEEKPVGYGYFVSVWKKQPDASWKVVIDIGTSNPEPTAPTDAPRPPDSKHSAARKSRSKINLEAERAALLRADRKFAARSTAGGTLEAFRAHVAEDVRLYRQNAFPFAGREAALSALEARPGLFNWQPAGADLARSADLGYTYGSYEFRSSANASDTSADSSVERGGYLRIWRRHGDEWKIVCDVTNPLPPPRPAATASTTTGGDN
ncbi:MAG TPA: nuclear transport factor 2 family protein [Pyrinomonadaceae bacterium]|jgi:ketosteroid isomerase-like protein